MPSASRCGRSAAPASGSSRPRNVGPASITVTLEPRRAKACPSSTPMAPAAEDRQRGRQLPRNRRLAIGPELDGVQARDGWDRRGAAVGDHHGAARDELLASDLDRAQVRQPPFASNEPGARSPPARRPAGCRRGRAPSTARVSRPWGSRRSTPRVRRPGAGRARPRSTSRPSAAASSRARSPSTGTRLRRARARPRRASARCPEGRRRSLPRRRHRPRQTTSNSCDTSHLRAPTSNRPRSKDARAGTFVYQSL